MTAISTREQPLHLPVARKGAPRGPAFGAAGGGPGFTGRDFLRVLRKRKWLILLCLVGFAAISVTGTLLWSLYAPWYTPQAFLEVRPPQGRLLGGAGRIAVSKDFMERRIRDQADMIMRDSVLLQVIEFDSVQQTKWYKQRRAKGAGELAEELKRYITVSPRPTSNLIVISMTASAKTSDERAQLAEIVNTLARIFVEDVGGIATRKGEDRIEKLRVQRDNLDKDLATAIRNLDSARPGDYPMVGERRNVLSIRIGVLERELTRMRLEWFEAESTLKAIEASENLYSIPGVKMQVDGDPLVRELRAQEVILGGRLETARATLGPEHRTFKAIKTSLNSVRTQASQLIQQTAQEAAASVKAMYETEADRLKTQIEQVRTEFNDANESLREIQQTLTDMEKYGNQVKNLQEKIDLIDRALLDERLIRGEEKPVILRQLATEPRLPSWPKWTVLIPLGVILGLMVGLGLAFLLEFMDTSIKGPSDLVRRTDLPLLGMVPHSDDMEEEIEDLRLAFMTHPNSLICEAFRQIRTGLLYSGPAEQRRSLLVTSALPEDGRGTVAMNLAAAMARAGRKVLVIDANFRQPMIHRLFPQCPEGGLSSALVGQADWKGQVCRIEENLSVMPSGPLPPNPAELLGSEAMKRVIAESVAEYDQVIFDGAPCLLVTDGSILSTMVDGVILVVRAGANTYGVVQRTREMLQRVGARILGVVLNGIRVTAGGYLRKNYDAFYDYHLQEQEQLPQAVGSSEDKGDS